MFANRYPLLKMQQRGLGLVAALVIFVMIANGAELDLDQMKTTIDVSSTAVLQKDSEQEHPQQVTSRQLVVRRSARGLPSFRRLISMLVSGDE